MKLTISVVNLDCWSGNKKQVAIAHLDLVPLDWDHSVR